LHHRSWLPRILSALLLAGVTACSGVPGSAHPVVRATGHGMPVLVFESDRQLVFADASGRTWQAARLSVPAQQLLWSSDGRRLAWLDDVQPQSSDGIYDDYGRLHVLDARTNRETSVPCACNGAAFLGDDVAALTADGAALLLLSPSATSTRVPLTPPLADVPLTASTGQFTHVAAGGSDRVTVSVDLDEQQVGIRGESSLVTVDRHGQVTPLLPPGKSGATSFRSAIAAPDGSGFVWQSIPSAGACQDAVDLNAVHYDGNPASRALGLPADPAFHQALLQDRRAAAVSWAGGTVVATFSPMPNCQGVFPSRLLSYAHQGDHWTLLANGLAGLAFGGDGRILELRPDHPIRTDDQDQIAGRLELQDATGHTLTLGDGVTAYAFTPAESAAGRPRTPSDAAPAAYSGLAAVDDQGHPLPTGPALALARRILTAAAGGDTSRLLQLCSHCATADLAWIRSPDGPTQVRQALLTHPAAVGGRLVYPGLVQHLCADSPAGQPDACTEQQIHDIALLGLPGGMDASHGGSSVYQATGGVRVVLVTDGSGAFWAGRG
jgi:hypothetical protein